LTPPQFLPPHPIALASANQALTGALKVGNTVTIRTAQGHGLTASDVGKAVTIVGVVDGAQPAQPIVGYDGTFVITAVPTNNPFQYNVPASTGTLPHGGNGVATYVTNANSGFYVVGPSAARYADAKRVPPLPATLASTGMSFAPPSAQI